MLGADTLPVSLGKLSYCAGMLNDKPGACMSSRAATDWSVLDVREDTLSASLQQMT